MEPEVATAVKRRQFPSDHAALLFPGGQLTRPLTGTRDKGQNNAAKWVVFSWDDARCRGGGRTETGARCEPFPRLCETSLSDDGSFVPEVLQSGL